MAFVSGFQGGRRPIPGRMDIFKEKIDLQFVIYGRWKKVKKFWKILPSGLMRQQVGRYEKTLTGYFLWMRLRINFGTLGPGMKMRYGGDLLFWILCLKAKETFTMKWANLLIRTTMTANCVSTPAVLMPRILGFDKIEKSSFAEELVLSEAERRSFSFWCL